MANYSRDPLPSTVGIGRYYHLGIGYVLYATVSGVTHAAGREFGRVG